MNRSTHHSFCYRNSLSIFAISFFLIFLIAQAITGWREYDKILLNAGHPAITLAAYLGTGNFLEITFENWESEFLQMFLYVVATIWFRQIGSAESKSLDGKEDVDRQPQPGKKAPWPVNRGGLILAIYKNSLSLAFLAFFLGSLWLHALGSYWNYQAEQEMDGKVVEGFLVFLLGSRFWSESFQNWQSEFMAIAAIVILSIYLRQQGSPESKPVDMPHDETP